MLTIEAMEVMADGFQPATAANSVPMAFSFDTPHRDVSDYVPARAVERLTRLRQRVSDKHSLTVGFQTRQQAHQDKLAAQARVKRLTDHRSLGGFEMATDAPQVVAEQKRLDAFTVEAKRLDDLDTMRSTEWRESGYALQGIDAYLRDGVPPGCVLEICETPPPTLPKGQTLTDAIQIRERRIRELQADARRVEATPMPSAYARKRMRQQISALAESGRPDVSPLIERIDGDIGFTEEARRVPVKGATEVNLASWQQPSAFLLTVFLNRDSLIGLLDQEITEAADDGNAMTIEQRQKAVATITSDMLAVDRELSELIWLAQAQNLPVEFRPDASPLAVLGLQLRTVARAEPARTTPGHGYDVVMAGR